MKGHLDEFRLLAHGNGETGFDDAAEVEAHLAGCDRCRGALGEMRSLDAALRKLASGGSLDADLSSSAFDPDDPFRARPAPARLARGAGAPVAATASDSGLAAAEGLLTALRNSGAPGEIVRGLALSTVEDRYVLYYALQQSGLRIMENPNGALSFATEVLARPVPAGPELDPAAEADLPWLLVQAQAHALAAQSQLWRRDFAKAQSHLVAAYQAFADGGDETSLAFVEFNESQRRSIMGEGHRSLALARRAGSTFRERGMVDMVARARQAEGLALFAQGRGEEALPRLREAISVFERYELWANYVSGLNNLATVLASLGRLDEARREFARVFKRYSRTDHGSWVGYLRYSLAEIHLASGRPREAAPMFARAAELFEESDLRANAVLAAIGEAECWARLGSIERARARLEELARDLPVLPALDATVEKGIREALTRFDQDSDEIGSLRRHVQDLLERSSG